MGYLGDEIFGSMATGRDCLARPGSGLLVGVASWPVTMLKDWANPPGPDFQPYFLSDDGTRMIILGPSGPLVVPLNELISGQLVRLAMSPPTISRFSPARG
jgi:hypothetical protein